MMPGMNGNASETRIGGAMRNNMFCRIGTCGNRNAPRIDTRIGLKKMICITTAVHIIFMTGVTSQRNRKHT